MEQYYYTRTEFTPSLLRGLRVLQMRRILFSASKRRASITAISRLNFSIWQEHRSRLMELMDTFKTREVKWLGATLCRTPFWINITSMGIQDLGFGRCLLSQFVSFKHWLSIILQEFCWLINLVIPHLQLPPLVSKGTKCYIPIQINWLKDQKASSRF